MSDPTPTPADPKSPGPKWYENPLVRKAAEYGVLLLLAFLASKGIKLPGEGVPAVVNVSYTPPHDAAK